MDGAMRIAQSVLKRYQDEGDQDGEAHSWLFIGLLQYKAGAMEESAASMGSALANFTKLGIQHEVGRCHRWLARINERTGSIDVSEKHFRLSWSAYVSCGDHAAVASVSLDIGDMLYVRDDGDEAAKWWVRSWNIAESQRLDPILDAVSQRYGLWCNRFFGSP
jgi:hypothetical protein